MKLHGRSVARKGSSYDAFSLDCAVYKAKTADVARKCRLAGLQKLVIATIFASGFRFRDDFDYMSVSNVIWTSIFVNINVNDVHKKMDFKTAC